MDSGLERNPRTRGSTWSVPGTTSNTLSWLRVSRMYRSFSGHISGQVPTKVLALSRSVLFTRAKWQIKRTYHTVTVTIKGKIKLKANATHKWQSKALGLEKGKHGLSRQVPGHQEAASPCNSHRPALHNAGWGTHHCPRLRSDLNDTVLLHYVC